MFDVCDTDVSLAHVFAVWGVYKTPLSRHVVAARQARGSAVDDLIYSADGDMSWYIFYNSSVACWPLPLLFR